MEYIILLLPIILIIAFIIFIPISIKKTKEQTQRVIQAREYEHQKKLIQEQEQHEILIELKKQSQLLEQINNKLNR